MDRYRFLKTQYSVTMALLLTACGGLSTVAQEAKMVSSTSTDGKRVALFQGPPSAPWATIGEQPGYVHLRAGSILRSEFVQQVLAAQVSSLIEDEPVSRKTIPLLLNTFESADANLIADHRKLASEDSDEGPSNRLTFSGNAFDLRFEQPMDWDELSQRIDWSAIGISAEKAALIQEACRTAEVSSHLALHGDDEDKQPVDGNLLPKLQALWALVDGGQVTAASVNPIPSGGSQDESGTEQEKMMRQIAGFVDCIALGLDSQDSVFEQHYQLAILPRGSVEELRNAIQTLQSMSLTKAASGSAASTMWETMEFSTTQSPTGQVLLLEFTHEIAAP